MHGNCVTVLFRLIFSSINTIIWDKAFKNGSSKICGRQPLKNLKGMASLSKFFKGCLPQILFGPLLNTLTRMMLSLSTVGVHVALVF